MYRIVDLRSATIRRRHKLAHCYICDKNLTTVLMDGRDGKPRPCSECEEIIQECINEQQEDAAYAYIESAIDEYEELIYEEAMRDSLGNT